jgi:hypothetical protein
MCEPATLTALGTAAASAASSAGTMALVSAAVAAAGAYASKNASDKAAVATATAQNRNTSEKYRQIQAAQEAAALAAREKMTDRSRQASLALSMARVSAAEGGGSLEARAINIAGDLDEDLSRIDTSLDNQLASGQDQLAAASAGSLGAQEQLQTQVSNNQMKFFTDTAGGAMNAYGNFNRQTSQQKLAKNERNG